MQQFLEDRSAMDETTVAFLDKNSSAWSNVPAFVKAVTDLKAAVAGIGTEADKQQIPTGGAAAGKAVARHALNDQIIELADQLAALAEVTGEVELAAQVGLSPSSLDKLGDEELGATATRIANLTTSHLTALGDYAVTAADVTELNRLAGLFAAAKTAPRAAIVERATATSALPMRVAAASRILHGRIDKLVTKFRKTDPEFVTGYRIARVIVNHSGHAAAGADAPAAQPPAPPA